MLERTPVRGNMENEILILSIYQPPSCDFAPKTIDGISGMRTFCFRSSMSFLAAVCMLGAGVAGAAASEDPPGSSAISLVLNKAKVLQLPPNAVTIVVGNPIVADVTMLKRTKHMILTGKGFGETNLIALDAQGRSVGESLIRVTAPTKNLIVQRGMERETWDCTPRCQPTFSLGDATKFSSESSAQIQSRNNAVGAPAR